MAYSLTIKNINKSFGDFQALRNISFSVEGGQFVTLLGPSGCGKTTLLRTIAGFLEPDQGDIFFGERRMNGVPPEKRNTAMCFQSYALFPHKNVFDNIAFGLRMRKVSKEEQKKRVLEAMEMVNLSGMEKRMPYELSGGQQQRVALARSIVVQPDILLFDEPLSNLDAKLRERVRTDIRKIQQTLGITTVYVTHDQAEALAVSDVIIAMNQGQIIQMTSPRDIYDKPETNFVADFIGSANLCQGYIQDVKNGRSTVECTFGTLTAEGDFGVSGDAVSVCIRPEDIVPVKLQQTEASAMSGLQNRMHRDAAMSGEVNMIEGQLDHSVYIGNATELYVNVSGKTLRVHVPKDFCVDECSSLCLCIPPDKIRLMKPEA